MIKVSAVLLAPYKASEMKKIADQRKNVNVRVTFDDNKKTYFRVAQLKANDIIIPDPDKVNRKKLPINWDKKLARFIEDKKINPNYEIDNKSIRDIIFKVETIISRLEKTDELITGKKLKDEFTQKTRNGIFIEFIEEKREALLKVNKIDSAEHYKNLASNFKKFCTDKKIKIDSLSINDINYDILNDFMIWGTSSRVLNPQKREKHWSPDYATVTKSRLRAVLNQAYRRGFGNAKKSPFEPSEFEPYMEVKQNESKPREMVLSYEQITELRDHVFFNYPWMRLVKLHLLKILLSKTSFTRVIEIKKQDYNEELKTLKCFQIGKKQQTTHVVTAEIKEIINWFLKYDRSETEYLFPLIEAKMINKDLKLYTKRLYDTYIKRLESIERSTGYKLFKLEKESEDWKFYWAYEAFDKHLVLAQKLFLTSYYCQGINLMDLAFLKQQNIKNNYSPKRGQYTAIEFNRSKTGGFVRVYIHPRLEELLKYWDGFKNDPKNPYLVPIVTDYNADMNVQRKQAINCRSSMNIHLKQMATKLGWPNHLQNLFFYVARHSSATRLADENFKITEIQKMLGHSSVETTIKYIKDLSRDEQMNKIDEAFD